MHKHCCCMILIFIILVAVMAGGRVEVIDSKGCSGLILPSLPSFRGLRPLEPMSPLSSSVGSGPVGVLSSAPFAGLVICVTGLSKEARKQVMEATKRLGGQYSPNLHPQCTHLVVQSFGGRKFEHAMKHGARNGLFVVTLGWFVDSVRKNVRLSESLFSVKNYGKNNIPLDDLKLLSGYKNSEDSCLPTRIQEAKQVGTVVEPQKFSGRESSRNMGSTLSSCSIYVDPDISAEWRKKVVETASREGASLVERWFAGCNVSHVVAEGTSIRRYLGYSGNLITPMWILKTAKEKYMQRLVHMSADLARQVGLMLEDIHNGIAREEVIKQTVPEDLQGVESKVSYGERQQIVNSAKIGVRNRRSCQMLTCQTPIRPITPNNLLDSICWSIFEPTSHASIYTDSLSIEDHNENYPSIVIDAKGDGKDSETSFSNSIRPLTESEKSELILKNHFLTILFPIDRFAEMGPSSRTFFSHNGFTCLQVLDHVYAFYQENLSAQEIEAAIHTDSRHADRLRSVYSSKETAKRGYVIFKRIDFLGSRTSFEMLKRVSGDNSSNVYELLLRA